MSTDDDAKPLTPQVSIPFQDSVVDFSWTDDILVSICPCSSLHTEVFIQLVWIGAKLTNQSYWIKQHTGGQLYH